MECPLSLIDAVDINNFADFYQYEMRRINADFGCTIPNCRAHKKFCRKCKKETPHTKVFKLDGHFRFGVPDSAIYIHELLCLECYPPNVIDLTSEKNINSSMLHNKRCYTKGICRCEYLYCVIDGCTNYCVNKDRHQKLPIDDRKRKCKEHELFCQKCNEEVFWIVLPNSIQPYNEYVKWNITCGKCAGYKKHNTIY